MLSLSAEHEYYPHTVTQISNHFYFTSSLASETSTKPFKESAQHIITQYIIMEWKQRDQRETKERDWAAAVEDEINMF